MVEELEEIGARAPEHRGGQEVRIGLGIGEQGGELAAQLGVVLTGVVEEGVTLLRRTFQGQLEEPFRPVAAGSRRRA